MLKKLLPILLTVLLCAAAAAESPMTFIITADMEFYSGPGTQYIQGAFHNTPPIPGEAATVLGRVQDSNGQDWLFVRFTGHWFSQTHPVHYYLPVTAAPEFADAPLIPFISEPNTLAAESVRVYADPEGTNYDGYLTPNDAGVTVLAMEGDFAYIEAVNPYGFLRRGYIGADDLASRPGMTLLPDAPSGTAILTANHPLPLAHPMANSYAQVLPLADGSLVLQYDSIPADAPWGEALAVIAPDGRVLANILYRTHDGMEESTIEFLLPGDSGFRVCRYVGDDLTLIHESHYTADGEAVRTDVRRYSDSMPRPMMGTASFTLSLGRMAYTEESETTLPLRVTAAAGASLQLNIGLHDSVPAVAECTGMLIVPVCTEDGTQLLVFGEDAALLCRLTLPEPLFRYGIQAVPTADGRIALLTGDGIGNWQGWLLAIADGTLTPGPTFTTPNNRRVNLLAADGEQLLVAVSGMDTHFLLISDTSQQLAGSSSGTVLHAQSGGASAAVLLMQDGALRLETWSLQLHQ